jgi:hypothetical protein
MNPPTAVTAVGEEPSADPSVPERSVCSDTMAPMPVQAPETSRPTAVDAIDTNRVTDQASGHPSVSGNIVPMPAQVPQISHANATGELDTSFQLVVCIVCGRRGIWKAELETRRLR